MYANPSENFLPFYKGDLVEVTSPRFTKTVRLRVLHCSERMGDTILLTDDNGGWEIHEQIEHVKLVARGNHFKWLFGFEDQLEFRDIAHEADFRRDVGEMLELRNPANGLYYDWTLDEAIAALEDGTAHAFFSSSSLGLLLKPMFGGFVCKHHEVAERMRRIRLADLRSLRLRLISA